MINYYQLFYFIVDVQLARDEDSHQILVSLLNKLYKSYKHWIIFNCFRYIQLTTFTMEWSRYQDANLVLTNYFTNVLTKTLPRPVIVA